MIEITEEMLDAIEAVKGRRDPNYWDPQCRRYMEKNKKAVKKLFEILGPRFKNRPGGYMRILKHGFKKGDASPKAYVELTEKS